MSAAAASPSTRTTSRAWTGWIAFAGWMMIIIGGIDFFEGLIAVIRGHYYVLTPTQIIVFNVSTWGWITLIWGIVLAFAGFALLAGRAWGRWFAIVAVSLNFLDQLGFLGNSSFPLWTLAGLTLSVLVLYALIVRWDSAAAG